MCSWGSYKKCKDGKKKAMYFKNKEDDNVPAYSAPMRASNYDVNRFLGYG